MFHEHLRAWFGSVRCAIGVAAVGAVGIAAAGARAEVLQYAVYRGTEDLSCSVALSDGDLLTFRAAGPGGTGMFALEPSSPPLSGGVVLTIRGEAFGTPEMSSPGMSSSGVLAFTDLDNGASSLFVRAPGGAIITIRGENFSQFRSSSVGPDGTVYAHVADSTGAASLLAFPPGGNHMTIVGSEFGPNGRAAVGSDGVVATRAAGPIGEALLAAAPGGSVITIVGHDRFSNLSSPASSGYIWVFGGQEVSSGLTGIFAQPIGGNVITIVGEQFVLPSFFSDPAANEAGAVVFARLGAANGGVERIQYSDIYGGAVQTLISLGDELLGSTVTELSFNPDGLNETGEFGYAARLADGTTAIMIASNVPAPGSLVLVGAGAAVCLRRRRREVA